jgi:hypothetical protein
VGIPAAIDLKHLEERHLNKWMFIGTGSAEGFGIFNGFDYGKSIRH